MVWERVGLDLSMFSDALRAYGIGNVMYPSLDLDDIIAPILLAAGTALIAATYPAVKAARLKPAEAVRHV